jgi:Tfp pilus assembly protein PilO
MMRAQWLKERADEASGAYRQGRGSRYKAALADLQKFRDRFYPKSHFARFITELYDIASKNGLEINSISYKPTPDKDVNLLKYALNLSVSGNYLQTKRFINDLGRCKNPVIIDTVSLANQNPTSGTVKLQVQIMTYLKMEAL